MRRNTFVTVSPATDYGMLRLQARSFPRYRAPDLVHEIIVIQKFERGHECDWVQIQHG